MIKNLKSVVIEPVLKKIGLFSKEAVDLVFGTACVESGCGKYLQQIKGPALGIYQMEPATRKDLDENLLKFRSDLKSKIDALLIEGLSRDENLVFNLAYATAMCRVQYLRAKGTIPSDVKGQAKYWKDNYNTALGKGTIEKYEKAWRNE